MFNLDYDIVYANLLEKIKQRLRRMPMRSLDDIISRYIDETGITINTEKLKKDVLQKIQADSSCSQCGKQGELFKVGDEDVCSACNTDFRRDVTSTPPKANVTNLAHKQIFMSKFAASFEETMRIIEERLKILAEDFEGTSLEKNIDSIVSSFKRILSGSDREFNELRTRGTDAVPAILEKVFFPYNLKRSVRNAVITDDAIRKAIANLIGEPQISHNEYGGIDDLSRGNIIDHPDNNDGGIFNATTTTGL